MMIRHRLLEQKAVDDGFGVFSITDREKGHRTYSELLSEIQKVKDRCISVLGVDPAERMFSGVVNSFGLAHILPLWDIRCIVYELMKEIFGREDLMCSFEGPLMYAKNEQFRTCREFSVVKAIKSATPVWVAYYSMVDMAQSKSGIEVMINGETHTFSLLAGDVLIMDIRRASYNILPPQYVKRQNKQITHEAFALFPITFEIMISMPTNEQIHRIQVETSKRFSEVKRDFEQRAKRSITQRISTVEIRRANCPVKRNRKPVHTEACVWYESVFLSPEKYLTLSHQATSEEVSIIRSGKQRSWFVINPTIKQLVQGSCNYDSEQLEFTDK